MEFPLSVFIFLYAEQKKKLYEFLPITDPGDPVSIMLWSIHLRGVVKKFVSFFHRIIIYG